MFMENFASSGFRRPRTPRYGKFCDLPFYKKKTWLSHSVIPLDWLRPNRDAGLPLKADYFPDWILFYLSGYTTFVRE